MAIFASTRRFLAVCRALKTAKKYENPGMLLYSWRELGGVFNDLAAYASLHPELLPSIDTPIVLEEKTAFGFEQVRRILEAELKRPLSRAFLSISHLPVFSDRISQTHRATLHNGTTVLVTVLVPQRVKQDARDLQLFKIALGLIKVPNTDLRTLLTAFERIHTRSGIRLARELETLAAQSGDTIRVPGVVWSHTTHSMLTTAYVQGVPLQAYMTDVLRQGTVRLEQSREVRLLAQQSLNAYVQSCLTHGIVSLDVSASSLSISPDGRLNLLRTRAGYLKPLERGHLIALIKSILTRDRKTMGRSLLMLGTVQKTMVLPQFQKALDDTVDMQSQGRVMTTVYQLLRSALSQGVVFRDDLIRFAATLRTIEETITLLIPDGSSGERVARRPALRLEKPVASPYRIDRFAQKPGLKLEVKGIAVPSRSSRYTVVDIPGNKPRATSYEPVVGIGIASASLFICSAALLTLAPISFVSIISAMCFFGLGCGSTFTLLKKS